MAYNPKIKLNVIEVFNSAFSSKPYEVRRTLRVEVTRDSFKSEFAAQCIEFIVDRTLRGKDKDGDRFVGYSAAYKKSLQFQLYKESSRPDMKLTGSMLASMEGEYTGNTITIQFDNDDDAAKAHGHINGANNLPVRDFFGITTDEAAKIMKRMVRNKVDQSLEEVDDAVEELDI